jgi:hypothetical protein
MNTQTQSEEEKTSKPDKSHLQLAKPKWLLAHHFCFSFLHTALPFIYVFF